MALTDLTLVAVVLAVLLPAVIGGLAIRWGSAALRGRGASPATVRGWRFLVTISAVIVALAGLTAILGPLPGLSALTFTAIAGLAVTLAFQTTFQNIIAGQILHYQHFLRQGDTIQLAGVKGSVVSIGLVEVVLRLDGGTIATVSNANLLNGPMINFTAASRLAGEY